MTRSKQPSLFPSLLPTDEAAAGKKKEAGRASAPKIALIDLNLVHPNPAEPRKTLNEEGLRQLADSIRRHGLLNPILVGHKNMESLAARFAEMFQVLKITCDQRFFLCVTPALELPLSGQSLAFSGICLGIEETNGAVLERVCRPPTIVVGLQTVIEVLCGADVEAFISTAEDVDIVHRSCHE